MEIIRRRAYARAGLVGNPSDGYYGKTLSVIVRDFFAEVVLYEWEDLELVWTEQDQNRFDTIHDLVRDVKLHGYYGGMRLLKATIKRFVEYCVERGIALHARKFSIRYQSHIPRQVGLAGSSAIIVATLRCLCDFYGVAIPREVMPSLALSVEMKELGITGGLQDRVIQVYEGLVYMDFARERMRKDGALEYGVYEPLPLDWLPPLYVAYSAEESEPTEVFHNRLRERFDRGDQDVVEAMRTFASLAADARQALEARDVEKLGWLMNRNFDTRRSICQLPAGHVQMVEDARAVGASAKFAGSGGAIVGIYRDEAMFEALQEKLKDRCRVLKPGV